MKHFSLIASVCALFVIGVVALPSAAEAVEPGRAITVRSDEGRLRVKKIGLEVVHRSSDADEIEAGDIVTLEVQADVDTNFTNPVVRRFSVSTMIANGKYNESSRQFTPTFTGLRPVKGYFVRARFISSEGEEGEWKVSTTRIVTLPPKAKDLRAPKKFKNDDSVRLRWDHPRRCQAEDCGYYVKVFNNRKKNKDLVYTSGYLRTNRIDIPRSTGLALGKKYRFKVLTCLERDLCHPKFSKQKKFRR